MLIMQRRPPHFMFGSYADVFFTSDGRATKVFRHIQEVPEAQVKKVFESEVHAYELAHASDDIGNLIPKFYGRVFVDQVLDTNNSDISGNYYLNFAYQMEHIQGLFVKVGGIPNPLRMDLIQRFKAVGISYLDDASVVVNGDRVSCVIDFATEQFEVWGQPL